MNKDIEESIEERVARLEQRLGELERLRGVIKHYAVFELKNSLKRIEEEVRRLKELISAIGEEIL